MHPTALHDSAIKKNGNGKCEKKNNSFRSQLGPRLKCSHHAIVRLLSTNNSPTFWIWMRDNFHCLYFCTQTVADGKRCFHSEQQHQPPPHTNSPGLTGCIWLCLSVSPGLMLKIPLKHVFLVVFPLLSEMHRDKGCLTHLRKLILAHCMFQGHTVFFFSLQRPCCIVRSGCSGSHGEEV